MIVVEVTAGGKVALLVPVEPWADRIGRRRLSPEAAEDLADRLRAAAARARLPPTA